jgi:hypothetical protein
MPLNKSWHEYNESLIERGRILMDIGFVRSSNREIKCVIQQIHQLIIEQQLSQNNIALYFAAIKLQTSYHSIEFNINVSKIGCTSI